MFAIGLRAASFRAGFLRTGLACAALLFALNAAAEDDEFSGLRAEPAKLAAIRASAMQSPPASLKGRARADFWRARDSEAIQLGDQALRRQIIDRALADLVADRSGMFMFRRRLLEWKLQNGVPRDEVLAEGEKLLGELPGNDTFILTLATMYVDRPDLARAEALVAQAEKVTLPAQKTDTDRLSAEFGRAKVRRQICTAKGDLDCALARAQEAVELSDRLAGQTPATDPIHHLRQQDRIWSRLNVLVLLRRLNRLDEARALQESAEALAAAQGGGGRTEGSLIRSRAVLENESGRGARALALLQKAEEAYQRAGAGQESADMRFLYNDRIRLLIEQGRMREAGQAVKSGTQNNERTILAVFGGDFALAEERTHKGSEFLKATYGSEHPATRRSLLMERALAALRGQDAAALPELLRECAETAEQQLFPQRLDRIYNQTLANVCLRAFAQGKARDAASLDAAFRLGASLQDSRVGEELSAAARRSVRSQPELVRILDRQDVLRRAIEASFENMAKAEQGKDAGSARILTELRAELQAHQTELFNLERELARRFPEFNQLTSQERIHLADASRQLGRDEVLLSLVPGMQEVYAWAITRDRPPLFFRASLDAAGLEKLVTRVRKTLDQGDQGQDRLMPYDSAAAYALYEKLLKPAAELMKGRHQLIVNAGGVLGRIPFGVLVSQPASAAAPTTPWLVRDYAISHVASVNAFVSLRQSAARPGATRSFIGFGDPAFARVAAAAGKAATRNLALPRAADTSQLEAALARYGDIPALPETRDEIMAVANALGADRNRDVYLGRRASRENVLKAPLGDYQVISFATHGLMAGDLPGLNQPALALAASDKAGENPLLLLEDVMTLRLNADWVVLSACNTAAADGQSSEALSGLARGFFYAGARSLLVTHWAVESASAQQLMSETFRAYANDKSLSRADALRNAQLKLMSDQKYGHPFFWAPYALVGDGA